ncbi:MAG: hypothetical protein IJG32_05985 [Selenomonadaceae bacterium]|nr:hypothetical protein [Selenomonadaceae bacterium]
MCFKQDQEKSLRGFEKFIVPVLKTAFGAEAVYSTERHNNNFETQLDCDFGIDALIVVDGTIYPVASRVQNGTNYESFSVRRSRPSGATTEFDKLSQAWRIQAPMPTYTVQGFIDKDGQIAVVGIAETIELLKYIGKHRDQWRPTKDGETFYYIPFAELENVKIYRVDENGYVH